MKEAVEEPGAPAARRENGGTLTRYGRSAYASTLPFGGKTSE